MTTTFTREPRSMKLRKRRGTVKGTPAKKNPKGDDGIFPFVLTAPKVSRPRIEDNDCSFLLVSPQDIFSKDETTRRQGPFLKPRGSSWWSSKDRETTGQRMLPVKETGTIIGEGKENGVAFRTKETSPPLYFTPPARLALDS